MIFSITQEQYHTDTYHKPKRNWSYKPTNFAFESAHNGGFPLWKIIRWSSHGFPSLLANCCDWRPGSESCWLKHFRRPPETSRRRGRRWLLRALQMPWRRPWEKHWKTMGRPWEKHLLLWWSLHVHVSLLEDNLWFHQTLTLDWLREKSIG